MTKPDQCPRCTAPPSYLEATLHGWFCRCCAKVTPFKMATD